MSSSSMVEPSFFFDERVLNEDDALWRKMPLYNI